jgi:hypothetical protein
MRWAKYLWQLVETASTVAWLAAVFGGIAVTIAAALYGAFSGLPKLAQVFAALLVFGMTWTLIVLAVRATRGAFAGRLASGSLDNTLKIAQANGRRLHSEAGELNPIGNLDRLDDLVRRYNEWEAAVSDALADDDDIPPEWRDLWLRDPKWHNSQVYPYTREQLDIMVRMIGHRLHLLDGMRRDLSRTVRTFNAV